jgi:hypothetical protein
MYARFANNWTAHSEAGAHSPGGAISIPAQATLKMHGNHFGKDSLKPGRNWLKKMSPKIPISNGKPSPSSWTPPAIGNKNNKSPPSGSTDTPKQMITPPPEDRPLTEVS